MWLWVVVGHVQVDGAAALCDHQTLSSSFLIVMMLAGVGGRALGKAFLSLSQV